MITKKQIIKIKSLQSRLRLSDEDYRLLLSDEFVNSCKDLTEKEADGIIAKLSEKAIAAGVWQKPATGEWHGKTKFENLGEREGFASPKQLRFIEALWKDVSFIHEPSARQIALRRFIFKIAGVDDLPFLTSIGARKVIQAIESIKKRHK